MLLDPCGTELQYIATEKRSGHASCQTHDLETGALVVIILPLLRDIELSEASQHSEVDRERYGPLTLYPRPIENPSPSSRWLACG